MRGDLLGTSTQGILFPLGKWLGSAITNAAIGPKQGNQRKICSA